ncbi:hypothetical protein [Acinetobacter sp. c3-l95]|uniref:hypothetical protein n=1 Tax=Acinetobacter sp. c3-l95 TaxID=3342804 RepID=UPI0035B6BC94
MQNIYMVAFILCVFILPVLYQQLYLHVYYKALLPNFTGQFFADAEMIRVSGLDNHQLTMSWRSVELLHFDAKHELVVIASRNFFTVLSKQCFDDSAQQQQIFQQLQTWHLQHQQDKK